MKCSVCKNELKKNRKIKIVKDNFNYYVCGKVCGNVIHDDRCVKLNKRIYYTDDKVSTKSLNSALNIIKTLTLEYGYFLNKKTFEEIVLPKSNFYGIKWSDEEGKVIFYTTKKDVYDTYR